MSVSGISSSSWFNYNTQSVQNNLQQFRQEFQQLGQDLQAGNLSSAQQDFATLQQAGRLGSSTSTSQSNSIAQQFNQLSQDLQSGNLSAAQQDYTTIQQDLQSQSTQRHHHHHYRGGSSSGSSDVSQSFNQLGQDLQSGNVPLAQQAYATLQQEFQSIGLSGGLTSTLQSSQSTVSATA